MLRKHFPEVGSLLDRWDQVALPLAEAPGLLRTRVERQLGPRELTQFPYSAEYLAHRITEYTHERAVLARLDNPPNLIPNQGSIWYERGKIAMEMPGYEVFDLRHLDDDEYLS